MGGTVWTMTAGGADGALRWIARPSSAAASSGTPCRSIDQAYLIEVGFSPNAGGVALGLVAMVGVQARLRSAPCRIASAAIVW